MFPRIVTRCAICASCFSLAVSAAPFSYANNPLGNDFPNPNSTALKSIEIQAHGSLPDTIPPPTLEPDTLTSIRLIAFGELFEVAFFTELLTNITTNVTGYWIEYEKDRNYTIKAITAIQAQEELHALKSNDALVDHNETAIGPCQYNFPVTTLTEAAGLASTFTDVVLGTLQDVTSLFGSAGDLGLILPFTSIIGNEGEQNGFFRHFLGKIPSALPWLTTSTRAFAFSAIDQGFVVPGSCGNKELIDLPVFEPLTVTKAPVVTDVGTVISAFFSFIPPLPPVHFDTTEWKDDYSGLRLAYINQQNVPIVEKLENVTVAGGVVSFQTKFPFEEGAFGNGLTIAAVVLASGNLTTAAGVSNATLFGPGLIEIN